MVILTATRLPTGYRLIAATSCCATRYRWYLCRNQQPIEVNVETTSINNVIAFDLTGAIVSGRYTVCVTHIRAGFNEGKELRDERSNDVFLHIAARHSVNVPASCHVHNETSNIHLKALPLRFL